MNPGGPLPAFGDAGVVSGLRSVGSTGLIGLRAKGVGGLDGLGPAGTVGVPVGVEPGGEPRVMPGE